jgi:transposase-like protein
MSQHAMAADTGMGARYGGPTALSEHRPGPGNGSANGGAPAEPAEDGTVPAIDALAGALREMAEDSRILEERLVELRRARAGGRPWREILSEEDPPGTMQVVSRMLATLAKASGTLRKELVDSLRREGVSIPAIARMFGVTHQRVSNLLRRPTE